MADKGLTPPTKKLVDKVLKRSTARYARSAPPVSKEYGDRYSRGFYTSSPEYKSENRLYGSKRANLTKNQQINKQFANHVKTKIKDKIQASVVKTMGNIKKLSPAGLVGAIMQPKKVGDATLKGNQGEYKRVK